MAYLLIIIGLLFPIPSETNKAKNSIEIYYNIDDCADKNNYFADHLFEYISKDTTIQIYVYLKTIRKKEIEIVVKKLGLPQNTILTANDEILEKKLIKMGVSSNNSIAIQWSSFLIITKDGISQRFF